MTRAHDFTRELALNAETGAPEWVHLIPAGRFTARDGRVFDNSDPAAIIANFRHRAVDLPIDYQHQNDRPEAQANGPVPAAGWIKELQARADGIWGRIEWTARARELIANREYRYISPVLNYAKDTKKVMLLKGGGLVHSPALHLTALAEQEDRMPEPDFISQIAEALGLDPASPPEAVLARICDLLGEGNKAQMAEQSPPDPAKFVPIATVQAMLAERNSTLATMNEDRAKARVKDAMDRGYLSPAMRDWALALCRSDEASFDLFLEKSIPHFIHIVRPRATTSAFPPDFSAAPRSAEEQAICEQLGLTPTSFAD